MFLLQYYFQDNNMLFWIIKVSFVSILLILLVHHLFIFLTSTLTVPKIKDLVNTSNNKYQHIYDTLTNNTLTNNSSKGCTDIELLPTNNSNDSNDMKIELKTFLKNQLNGYSNDNVSSI